MRLSAVVAAGLHFRSGATNCAITAVMFYLLTYAVMNIGAFAVVQLIARSGDRRTSVEDYSGIGFRITCAGVFAESVSAESVGHATHRGLHGEDSRLWSSYRAALLHARCHRCFEHGGFRLLLPATDHRHVFPRTNYGVDRAADSSQCGSGACDHSARRSFISESFLDE